MSKFQYILEGRTPKQEPDLHKWGRWMETGNRRVALDEHSDCRISTVFLGLDHNHTGGIPILFETMIFGGPPEIDQMCERYETWEDAEKGHARILTLVKNTVW